MKRLTTKFADKVILPMMPISPYYDFGDLDKFHNARRHYEEYAIKLAAYEDIEEQIIETIARNCVAWDTSKDKREGLLPEVAVFSNPYLYKKLTGKEYNFSEVCRKYHIDN